MSVLQATHTRHKYLTSSSSYFFPIDRGFQIARSDAALRQCDYRNSCYLVCYASTQPCFILTYADPAKLGRKSPFYRWGQLGFHGRDTHIQHIHANGLTVDIITLVANHENKRGGYYAQRQTRPEADPRYASHNDVLVLEELGWHNILASVQTAWGYAGLVLEASSLPECLPGSSDQNMGQVLRFYQPTEVDYHPKSAPLAAKLEQGRQLVGVATSSSSS